MSDRNIRNDELQKSETKSEVSMSLFDINSQIISQLPIHSTKELAEDVNTINKFDFQTKSNYYMLLCKELSYYTLFTTEGNPDPESFGDIVIECVTNLGSIHTVDIMPEGQVEIWISNDEEEMYCIHLFDYAQGVVHFKR